MSAASTDHARSARGADYARPLPPLSSRPPGAFAFTPRAAARFASAEELSRTLVAALTGGAAAAAVAPMPPLSGASPKPADYLDLTESREPLSARAIDDMVRRSVSRPPGERAVLVILGSVAALLLLLWVANLQWLAPSLHRRLFQGSQPASRTLVVNAERDGKPVAAAEVYVDGQQVCTFVPCRVKDVAPGWREVRVESGTLARSESFEMRSNPPETEVTVRLVATAAGTSTTHEAHATKEDVERFNELERLKAKLRALEEQSDERGSTGGGRGGKRCMPGDPLCSDHDVRAVPSPDALRRRLKSEAEAAAQSGCAPDDLVCKSYAGAAKRRP